MKIISKHFSLLAAILFIAVAANAQQVDGHINISNFKTYQSKTKQVIEWSTDAAKPTNYWMVQSSSDGKEFTTIGLVLGADPGQQGDKYIFTQPIKSKIAKSFYRLSHVKKEQNN
jgi:hypothetical protein